MPQATVQEYWLHPEGLYDLQLVGVEDAVGQWGPQVKWIWETPVKQQNEFGEPILDDNGVQRQGRVVDYTSCTASAKSAFGKLLVAMGKPLPKTKEEAAAMDDAWFKRLIGTRVRAQIIHNLLDDGRVFANVKSYAPIAGQAAAPAAADPQPAGKPALTPSADCPDPFYHHTLKPGEEGYDADHKCRTLKKAA